MRAETSTAKFPPTYLIPPIFEVLGGALAARYGVLPVLPLPQEGELLISFASNMGWHLREKELYRRDHVIVMPGCGRMDVMEPEIFCSWSQRHVVTSKIKYDKNGEPFQEIKDMSTEVAKKVLISLDFASYVPQVGEVRPVPTPRRSADGKIVLADCGLNNGVFTFPFPGGYHDWDLRSREIIT